MNFAECALHKTTFGAMGMNAQIEKRRRRMHTTVEERRFQRRGRPTWKDAALAAGVNLPTHALLACDR
jgi:hypothetical protein